MAKSAEEIAKAELQRREEKINRRAANKLVRAEDLRARIANGSLLTYIVKTELEFARIARETKQKGKLTPAEKNAYDIQLKALTGRQASQFKRLDKILPDIKAIEFQDGDGNSLIPAVQFVVDGQKFNPFPIEGESEIVDISASSEATDGDPKLSD